MPTPKEKVSIVMVSGVPGFPGVSVEGLGNFQANLLSVVFYAI